MLTKNSDASAKTTVTDLSAHPSREASRPKKSPSLDRKSDLGFSQAVKNAVQSKYLKAKKNAPSPTKTEYSKPKEAFNSSKPKPVQPRTNMESQPEKRDVTTPKIRPDHQVKNNSAEQEVAAQKPVTVASKPVAVSQPNSERVNPLQVEISDSVPQQNDIMPSQWAQAIAFALLSPDLNPEPEIQIDADFETDTAPTCEIGTVTAKPQEANAGFALPFAPSETRDPVATSETNEVGLATQSNTDVTPKKPAALAIVNGQQAVAFSQVNPAETAPTEPSIDSKQPMRFPSQFSTSNPIQGNHSNTADLKNPLSNSDLDSPIKNTAPVLFPQGMPRHARGENLETLSPRSNFTSLMQTMSAPPTHPEALRIFQEHDLDLDVEPLITTKDGLPIQTESKAGDGLRLQSVALSALETNNPSHFNSHSNGQENTGGFNLNQSQMIQSRLQSDNAQANSATAFAPELPTASTLDRGNQPTTLQDLPASLRREIDSKAATLWRQGNEEIHLQLMPEHLGKVQVALEVRDGIVNAHIRVQSEMARQTVDQGLQELRDSLTQHGFKIDNLSVSVEDEHRGLFNPGGSSGQGFFRGREGANPDGSSDKDQAKDDADHKENKPMRFLGYNTLEFVA